MSEGVAAPRARAPAPITRRGVLAGSVAAGGVFGIARLLGPASDIFAAVRRGAGPPVEDWVPTTCWLGKQDCGILARRIDGHVVKLAGNPVHPRNRGTLCPKGQAQIMSLYDPRRVKTPLVRTNTKGATGEWRRASWDEALTLVGARIAEARARGTLLWQRGASKSEAFYDQAFVAAARAQVVTNEAIGAGAAYRAVEYTLRQHGAVHPDLRYARMVLAWGWNVTGAGGNRLCWVTWPQELVTARETGLKLVAIDPRRRGSGQLGDQWLPIRPGTDLALALAICHALIAQHYVDRAYLLRSTNAPFLVADSGELVRVGGKPQVWDTARGAAAPFDAPGLRPALEGTFTVAGRPATTAYSLFVSHLAQYAPEWAGPICGVRPATIWLLAKQLGDAAQIGTSIDISGVTVPLRPVGLMAQHVSQQELGFQAVRAMLAVFMLLGAIGAAGGVHTDFGWSAPAEADESVVVTDPPYDAFLSGSRYFPINSRNPGIMALAATDPSRYGAVRLPEVLLLHMSDPVLSCASRPDVVAGYAKIPFVAAIDPWLSETADLFADVVLPAATMEKYEGPFDASTMRSRAVALRLPVMEPLFESRGDVDIYMDLCAKAGILHGAGGYLDRLNGALGLSDELRLPLDRRPATRDIFDRWARSEGISDGIRLFERVGLYVRGPHDVRTLYAAAAEPPFGDARHRLYGESLLGYQRAMRAKGADETYWRDYTPFPTWRQPSMERSPRDYDLYLISYKLVEYMGTRSTRNPLLAEQQREQSLEINPETARERGIADGQEVTVESHNAVTGETRSVRVRASFRDSIRPDTVGMAHHFGGRADGPGGRGPSPNELFFTGEGYVTNTADQSFQVKVRVRA